MLTAWSPTNTRPSPRTDTVMRSPSGIRGWLATGSETSMPRLIIGAVTMKTSSSTSTTSTSGVTLISPSMGVVRRERSPRYAEPAFDPPDCACIAPGAALREVALDDVQELEREVVHHRREHSGAAGEEVEEDRRRDGGEQTHRGGDERLRDARRNHREVGGAHPSDVAEGVHDAPDRAEEAD